MPSPFPGMDPYLESSGAWPGFHHALLTHCHDYLNERLPASYAAIIEERVQLVDLDEESRRSRVPDISVIREDATGRSNPSASTAVLDLEAVTLAIPDFIEDTQGYINVLRLPEHHLVSSIEILSPSNKVSPGWGEFVMKRRGMLAQGVNLVEIDLLLAGQRLDAIEPLPKGDYYAFVSRAQKRNQSDVYVWSIRRKLPKIPVPLRAPDSDVVIDLSTLFATTYERGRYLRTLPYQKPLELPLAPDDLKWAAERTKSLVV